MNNWTLFNPDDWKDVFVLTFFGVCSVATVALPIWLKVRKIDDQVTNNHDENLRDEITRGFKEIREDISVVREELRLDRASINSLRDDLRVERTERIDGDKRRVDDQS